MENLLKCDSVAEKETLSLVFLWRDDAAGGEDAQRLLQEFGPARRREARQVGHRHAAQGALPVHALHLLHQHLYDTSALLGAFKANLSSMELLFTSRASVHYQSSP